jgi:hypothetical protein
MHFHIQPNINQSPSQSSVFSKTPIQKCFTLWLQDDTPNPPHFTDDESEKSSCLICKKKTVNFVFLYN